MAKFQFKELIVTTPETARLGAGETEGDRLSDADVGKIVKLAGDSRYNLVAAGDAIEGVIAAVESYTADGYSIGSVQVKDRKEVTFDGLQATPGTGTVAVGDYVVCGTVVAAGTQIVWPAQCDCPRPVDKNPGSGGTQFAPAGGQCRDCRRIQEAGAPARRSDFSQQ